MMQTSGKDAAGPGMIPELPALKSSTQDEVEFVGLPRLFESSPAHLLNSRCIADLATQRYLHMRHQSAAAVFVRRSNS
jgi:hypothetical protein